VKLASLPGLARPFLVAAVLGAMAGCALFNPDVDLEVIIPPPPARWLASLPDLRFTLVYPDGCGCLKEVSVDQWQDPVAITCGKTANAPVLAYPWSPGAGGGARAGPRGSTASAEPGDLRPAGGLWPSGSEAEDAPGGAPRLVLSWEDGPLAEVFRRLWEGGIDTGLVNSARLSQYMRRFPDPWKLDLVKVAQKLAEGGFTAYDIDCLPTKDVVLYASEGEWFMEDPFVSVLTAGQDGCLGVPAMTYGQHVLFGPGGARLQAYLDARGLAVSGGDEVH
jgi:hypothetical protein